jgi:hypothetical protein
MNASAKKALRIDGNLRYFGAKSFVVAIKTSMARVKLCRIQFGGDGSIYVPFPYSKTKRGVVGAVRSEPASGTQVQLNIAKAGVAVEQDVKFTHHVSGIVQFSRTGMGVPLPRRRSFPLSGIGHLFELQVYWLSGLTWVADIKPRDLVLEFNFGARHPTGVFLRAEWRTKANVQTNAVPAGGTVGPTSEALNIEGRTRGRVVFIGPPKDCPLQSHVVTLTAEEVPIPVGISTPTMIFLGGYDDQHATRAPNISTITGALAFMYPYTGPDLPTAEAGQAVAPADPAAGTS